jgi:hypothetical protein
VTRRGNMVVCRDAIVITVGARPIEYQKIDVVHNKTGAPATIDNQNVIVDEGDEGIPYAFKAFQKVNRNHPAVRACPSAFMELAEAEDAELVEA